METKKLISGLCWTLALVFIALAGFAVFRPVGPWGYGGWHMAGRGVIPWGMGGMMMIFWIFLLVGLVLVIQWISRLTQGATAAGEPDALEILRRRYARGEIERPEYESRLRDLRDAGSFSGPVK